MMISIVTEWWNWNPDVKFKIILYWLIKIYLDFHTYCSFKPSKRSVLQICLLFSWTVQDKCHIKGDERKEVFDLSLIFTTIHSGFLTLGNLAERCFPLLLPLCVSPCASLLTQFTSCTQRNHNILTHPSVLLMVQRQSGGCTVNQLLCRRQVFTDTSISCQLYAWLCTVEKLCGGQISFRYSHTCARIFFEF